MSNGHCASLLCGQDTKPPLCCPTCTSTVDAPCRTPGYGTDNCDFQQVRGRLFRAAPCLQRLASSSCAHLVRPLARTTAGEKNWRRGKRTARMEARARTRLRITIASALTGGQVRPHCTASDVCARRFMTGRCWAFRQGLHQLRWHVQPHVWRQDWVVAGPLRHALGGRPGLCTYLQHQLCNCVASLTAPARAGGVCAVRARKEGEMIDTLLTKQLGFAFTSA